MVRSSGRKSESLRWHKLSHFLPAGFTPVVRPGEQAEADSVIARGRSDITVLELPDYRNLLVLKKPGDRLKTSETVAVTHHLFRSVSRSFLSPMDGMIEDIRSHRLLVADSRNVLRALVPGRVTDVSPDRVVIESRGIALPAVFATGDSVRGELLAVGELLAGHAPESATGSEVEGRIVMTESYVSTQALRRLAQYNAAGVICAGLDFGPLWQLVSAGGPFPGGKGLPTVVVTEGFGVQRMSQGTLRYLRQREGRPVYLQGPPPRKFLNRDFAPCIFIPE